MDRHITLTLLLLGALQLTAATNRQELIVHFEKDVSILNEEAIIALEDFISSIQVQGDYHFIVEGHTDSDGSNTYNDTLASARAHTVREYLLRHGAEPALVDITYLGERKPVASNASLSGMALNRRVDIIFTRNTFANTDELRKALMAGTVQRFTLDPTRDNQVVGQAGVKVLFRKGAFTDANGWTVETPVTIELTEALGPLQMMAHRLSTRSDGRLLETDGMLQVQAMDGSGDTLKLEPDAPMSISIPTAAVQPRMQLFLSTTGANWDLATRSDTVFRDIWEEDPPDDPLIPFKLPKYVEDQNGKPVRPVQPVMPRVPHFPRQGNYVPPESWWSFLRPHVMQERSEKALANAAKRYEMSRKKYKGRMEHYDREVIQYPAAIERYGQQMALWEERKKAEYANWQINVYQATLGGYDAIAAPILAQYQADLAAWKAKRASRMQRYTAWAKTTRSASLGDVSNYVFVTSRLGWINCDRFFDVPEERKQQVIVQGKKERQEEVYLVFTGMRMLLNMGRNDANEHISPPAPVDEPAVIFAYTVIDGQAQISVQPLKPGEKPVLRYEPSSVAEVGRRLAELAGT